MSSYSSYTTLVADAIEIVKREKKFSFYFLQVALPSKKFEIFCLIYSYFRILDDIIDAPNRSSKILKKLVVDEKRYITSLYKKKCANQVDNLSIHQHMLWYVVDYDISQGTQMKQLIYEMFRGFEFDVEYRYKLCSQDMLDLYTTTAGNWRTRP